MLVRGKDLSYLSLASGSQGNATLIYDKHCCFLVDCGVSVSSLENKLSEKGLSLEHISALFLTHEHSDHIAGVRRLSRFVPIYMSRLLYPYVYETLACADNCCFFSSDTPFEWNHIKVNPVSIPHDCVDPVAFTFDNGSNKIGIVTDVGHVTRNMLLQFEGCSSLLVESNYDRDMLQLSARPASLKRRISGPLGHLSNMETVYFLKRMKSSVLKKVALLHVSQDCNDMDLAFRLAQEALGHEYTGLLEIIMQSGEPYHRQKQKNTEKEGVNV